MAKPTKPAPGRTRHVPQRSCVACRETEAKGTLVRLVRTGEGVFADPTGKQAGRGAYLHAQRSCWERGIRHNLATALRTSLSEADVQRLTAFFEALPQK
ncbi:MAG: YlxR family protein [Anaerolineales bacterium]|nr:MAG: YlxR family protein [Anaerolineales bacterium]